jgi:hypothetical protein
VDVLQVTLPTNFRSRGRTKSTAILRQLEKDIEAVRFDAGTEDRTAGQAQGLDRSRAARQMGHARRQLSLRHQGRHADGAGGADIETSRSVPISSTICVKLGANPTISCCSRDTPLPLTGASGVCGARSTTACPTSNAASWCRSPVRRAQPSSHRCRVAGVPARSQPQEGAAA